MPTLFDESWPRSWGTPGTHWRVRWADDDDYRCIRFLLVDEQVAWEKIDASGGTMTIRGPIRWLVENGPVTTDTTLTPMTEEEWTEEWLLARLLA